MVASESRLFFHLGIADWPPAVALAGIQSPGTYYFLDTPWAWILQTWHRLREKGHDIELTSALPESGIIVLCSGTLPVNYKPGPRQFFVSVCADESPDQFAQMYIVQNEIQTRLIPDSHYMPHWPQPGLIPRDPARGTAFSSVAYFGDEANLAPEFTDGRWAQFMAAREMTWHVRGRESDRNIDFSDIDAVVAVRSFRRSGFIRKPATKLANAWLAGVPAIVGRERAMREQRRSDLDYIEVASFDEACAAIDRLARSPDLRRAMADNGRMRSPEVSVERITERWEHLLYDVAPEQARRWAAKSAAGRDAFLLGRQVHKKLRGGAHRVLRWAGQEQFAL
jgi:hypothetical protein